MRRPTNFTRELATILFCVAIIIAKLVADYVRP